MQDLQAEDKKDTTRNPKEIFLRYAPFFPWIALSLVIALTISWVKLRYSTPVFNVAGKILVKNNNPYATQGEKFSNILGMPNDNTNLNNEIEIIKSNAIAERVARQLSLSQQYAFKGQVRTAEASVRDLPFKWLIESVEDSAVSTTFDVFLRGNNQFSFKENGSLISFGEMVKVGKLNFRLLQVEEVDVANGVLAYTLTWTPLPKIEAALSNSISVVKVEGASVLNISYKTPNTRNGVDIVNSYMREYQLASLEDKKEVAANTLSFIDEQLDTLRRDLGGVESNLQHLKEANQIFNPEVQADQSLTELTAMKRQINEASVKMQLVDYLVSYLSNSKNHDRLVPSNLGIEEPSLVQQITAFNELQLRKETMLKSTTAENPMIVSMNSGLEKLRSDMIQNLANVKAALNLTVQRVQSFSSNVTGSVRSIPGKEKQLLEVTRRQAILQELYSFLLQKKLETAISSASTISDIKILEPALAGSKPISPNKRSIYTIASLIGLAIPLLLIFLIDFFNDKVAGRKDIERSTQTPILGEIGHADDSGILVVKENNREYISEQFRIIRSNLQYVTPKNNRPVILVTSSFSGEGKSFISINLGAVIALSGKKTVILEMDIRKPKVLQGLGMKERKGITNYLVSNLDVEDIIYKVPDVENLYVIPCGPVPPNPAEMLLDEKMGELFNQLKKTFDSIIIDSAPVGLVSDAFSLSTYANATVFIVRHYYTYKKQLELIDDLYINQKLPHMSIVINDIQMKSGYGSYYGYGYGYGSRGNTYYQIRNRKNWFKSLKISIMNKINK